MLRTLKHMPGALRKHGGRAADYGSMRKELGGTVPADDPALNLYLRLVLEHGYRTVIEIGAFRGARILALKRLLPQIEAWALDILPDYATPRMHAGVNFSRYDLPFFARGFDRALVCARGTLCYFPPEALAVFFAALAQGRMGLALYEPVAYRDTGGPLMRTPDTYYHAYDHAFRQAGLAPETRMDDAVRFAFNLSMMEAWYAGAARPPVG